MSGTSWRSAMTEVHVSRDDIEALAQTVDTAALSEGSKALLSAIVAAIHDVVVSDDEPVVTVSVDVVTELQDEFATAFTADPVHAAASAVGVKVAFSKIGR
jgi:hypothetical protein